MRRVALLYGGRSSEHSISCLSARSVLDVIDRSRYEVLPIGITEAGRWTLTDGVPAGEDLPRVADDGPTVGIVGSRCGPRLVRFGDDGPGDRSDGPGPLADLGPVDVAFPLLHGPWGEDGTVQGLLATVGVPYVGADVTASSIGVDKAAMKAAFAAQRLPQLAYRAIGRVAWEQDPGGLAAALEADLPLPWFVKPARQGSSIGISKVDEVGALAAAMTEAFAHGDGVLVEEAAEGARELEVGVLGDDELEVTRPGEIRPARDFYDFEAKYLATSELVVPALVRAPLAARVDELARAAFRAIGCRGMARVDFFVLVDGRVVINEINTIPGFTPASMFPRLWEAEGLDYTGLVDRLLAQARA